MPYARKRTAPAPKKSLSFKKRVFRKTPKATKTFTKKVMQVVKKTQEVKQYNVALQSGSVIETYNPVGGVIEYFDLIGGYINGIVNGTTDGTRIGDRIMTRKFILRGYLNIDDNAETQYLQYVRMLVIKDKQNQSLTGASANTFVDLFEGLTPATSTPANTLQDIMRNINNERYTVLAQRVFKLGPATGGAPAPAPTNNDFKVAKFFKIDLTKHLKSFTYNTTTNVVTNHPSVFCVWLTGILNTAIVGGAPTGVVYSMSADYKYSDA